MAVVKDYTKGNCRTIICDDSVVKTKEENDKIINDISAVYSRYFSKHPEQYGKIGGLKILE